ncbi:ankyrin repeat-containing protein, putative [Pediculus humanus corporis]|uniref:Ankyrin repeat-containing protein, putative n=1 Tax=Pediculus humanus subsp. corporis TaxID=121224 RepID=E0VK34_PEDHC|nr:ankyrin repeat-containing protein, putative [Pediculus humanus corporis]EEB13740.1 ankyrin repeat-containing protein, putative [Pediculus humanus corporis]
MALFLIATVNSGIIHKWLNTGDLYNLEKLILRGQGQKLVGEKGSNESRVRNFLKQVPEYLDKINELHEAASDGNLGVLEKVAEDIEKDKNSKIFDKNIFLSQDQNGDGLLHKAVYFGHTKIVQFLVKNYPKCLNVQNKEGLTPLHLCGGSKEEPGKIWQILINAGANSRILDLKKRAPSYYMQQPNELVFPVMRGAFETSCKKKNNENNNNNNNHNNHFDNDPTNLIIKPSSLRIWIHNKDFTKLQKVIWGGHGNKLLVETTNDPAMKKFLDGVPHVLNSIKNLHLSVIDDDFNGFVKNISSAPLEILDSRDINGLNILHKGSGLNRWKIVKNILDIDNTLIRSIDRSGRTALHYAATTLKNDNHLYDLIISYGADKNSIDNNNKKPIYYKNNFKELIKLIKVVPDSPRTLNAFPPNWNWELYKSPESKIITLDNLNDGNIENGDFETKNSYEMTSTIPNGNLKIQDDDITETDDDDDNIDNMILNGNLEGLASLVLNGEGEKLIGKVSENSDVQYFLENVPSYLKKIKNVHDAAKNGSLKELKIELDRRKFAIAKESGEKTGVTPLHVAVLNQKHSIIKYLGKRFPETLNTKDNLGRTPLHYAAVLSDDGFIYKTLTDFGGDLYIKDDRNFTPQDYKKNSNLFNYDDLIKEFINVSNTPTNKFETEQGAEIEIITSPEHFPTGEINDDDDDDDNETIEKNGFATANRDEFGQSILHFAAARANGRNGFFQLIQETSLNLGFRDELYRTARDVAVQANLQQNVQEIDKYVISLAAKGETEKIKELFLEGYDHIIDLKDEDGINILDIATQRTQNEEAVDFLKRIPEFEIDRDQIHDAIRIGNHKLVQDIGNKSKRGKFAILGKNKYGRCSIHIAVLCQQKEIMDYLAGKFSECLRIGDNLERTALHYAMGLKEVEILSEILIKFGAERISKDLKGRQPTYYFINKTEILQLQEEEAF